MKLPTPKGPALGLVLVAVVVSPTVVIVTTGENSTACDGYGDCITYGVSPSAHSNPDGTYYFGDVFTFDLEAKDGPNTTGYSIHWSYDPNEFTRSGDAFTITGNGTGSFGISTGVTFQVTLNGTSIGSTLKATERVDVVQLMITSKSSIVNFTDPSTGFTLRNEDGSFFRNDSFCVKWSVSFQFSDSRTDILVNATGSLPVLLTQVSSNYTGGTPGRQGFACYDVALTAPYSNGTLPLNFNAINWQGASIARVIGKVPFAVVQYSPMFSKYTYTDYNSTPSNAYQKSFVTLVRYGGNRPGYDYAGNNNTAPFRALNSTGERALIDNYTFTTEGFSPLFNENQGATFRLGLNDTGKVDLNIASTNKTTTVLMDWAHRVVKCYFLGRTPDYREVVPLGIEYLNVTERLNSLNFAGASETVINSSYAYQPIFYNGNLTFHAVNQHGAPDPGANVTLTAVNPNPIDPYLIREVISIFGNDTQVIHAFKQDLYAASATAQTLMPHLAGNGTWEYFVNQTNLQLEGGPPSAFQVTVAGHGVSFTYSFSNSFGLYLIPELPVQSNSSFLEWQNVTAYTFGEDVQFRSMPLTFNFSMPAQFLSWSGPPDWNGSFLPPEGEPGGYSLYSPFLYGMNNTVTVNLVGGGASATSATQGSSVYTTIDVGPLSGGAQSFWARDGNGTGGHILFSSPVLDNMGPPAPPGFEGVRTFVWSPDTNGTVTLGIVNTYGVNVPIGHYQAVTKAPISPTLDETLMVVFLGIAAGFVLLGKAIHRHHEEREPQEPTFLS